MANFVLLHVASSCLERTKCSSSASQSCFAVVANESSARPAASRTAVQKLISDASESCSPREANAENDWRCAAVFARCACLLLLFLKEARTAYSNRKSLSLSNVSAPDVAMTFAWYDDSVFVVFIGTSSAITSFGLFYPQ